MIKSEYIRIGSDRGGEVEITLRPDRFGKTGGKSVVFRTPTGAEFKLDHPKDVSGVLSQSLAEVLGMLDKLVDDSQAEARETTKKARKRSGGGRMLEIL